MKERGFSHAFSLLLDEVQALQDELNRQGAAAFEAAEYSRVDSLKAAGLELSAFRKKILGLREEWKSLISKINLPRQTEKRNISDKLKDDNTVIRIPITEGSLKHNYLRIARFDYFFPRDSVGPSNRKDGQGKMLQLWVEGIGLVETDIAGDKMGIRGRGWCGQFYKIHKLRPGDEVIMERVGTYQYTVKPNRR